MDWSKLPDSQRQELEQLQKQFHEHQAQQQKQHEPAAAVQRPPPPAYDPFQVHQSYVPSSQAYDHSYYYNNYHDPSQQRSQYDASYYQNYHSNPYHQPQQQYKAASSAATAYTAPIEPQRNGESGSGYLGIGQGQVHDPYVNQVNLGGVQPNPGYAGPPGINPSAAAAAVAALSQLTQFAGAMGAPMAGGGHYDQGHFRPPVGHTPYRGGGRRGGGPFRGGGRGNSGFRPSNTGGPPFHGRGGGRGRDRDRGRGRRARRGPAVGAPSSLPESSAQANAQPPARIAWCEVCRVDCTSEDMLNQHNNGRRHQKNLQKLQNVKGAYQPVVQMEKETKPGSEIGPEVHESVPENEPDKQTEVVGDGDNKVEREETGNQEKKQRMKRRMKGRDRVGRRGGKRMRPTGPRNPKVVIPLVCDLCNIKCDTQEVFNKHAAGKRHISKLKRYAGHQAMYGPTAVQALYPPNPLSQTLAPQPAYYDASSSYAAPPEAYIPPPYPAHNPNADAPLEFGTQNAVSTGNGVQ